MLLFLKTNHCPTFFAAGTCKCALD